MAKKIHLIGTLEDTENGFFLNSKNKEDFVARYGPYFKKDETTIVLCFGFKSPVMHTTDIITFGILGLPELKTFFVENDIDTSFQGINYPFSDDDLVTNRYDDCVRVMQQLSTSYIEPTIPQKLRVLSRQVNNNDFKYQLLKKPQLNNHIKGCAIELLRITKQMHDKITTKADEYAQIYDNVFILVPTVHALLIKLVKPKYELCILETGMPESEITHVLFQQLLPLHVIPQALKKK